MLSLHNNFSFQRQQTEVAQQKPLTPEGAHRYISLNSMIILTCKQQKGKPNYNRKFIHKNYSINYIANKATKPSTQQLKPANVSPDDTKHSETKPSCRCFINSKPQSVTTCSENILCLTRQVQKDTLYRTTGTLLTTS